VGASGGIATYWTAFGRFFKAFGFEPLLAECERLNAQNTNENVAYFPYFIVPDNQEVKAETGHIYQSPIFQRTSATRAAEVKKMNYIKEFYNDGKETVVTDKEISLDSFFSSHPVETVDFIKIDTDGYDYGAIHSAQELIKNKQVLGVTIEAPFHGKAHSHSNVFRNIDRFLIDAGFLIYDLEVCRYSKRDLPARFAYSFPAQTVTGQVIWGEALYFRDCVGSRSFVLSPIKLLKLACLYELFGLPDCAAELLNTFREKLSPLIDIELCLNLLVKNMKVEATYSEYIKQFEENLESFYPQQVVLKQKFSRFLKLNRDAKKKLVFHMLKKIWNKAIN
jgi:FkbM family methyltransferase